MKYAKAASTIDSDSGAILDKTVNGPEGQDNQASLVLADKFQDNDDWRHHLFANPLPDGEFISFNHSQKAAEVDHGVPRSNSRVYFKPESAYIITTMPNHNGYYDNDHWAKLDKDKYNALREDAATDNVEFPPFPEAQ